MNKKFENINALATWMAANGDRNKRYYYSLDINTCEMEVSNNRLNESIYKIVKHPDAITRGKHWRSHIVEAFGGFVCKSSVKGLLGKTLAEMIHWDALSDNPHYKSSSPMKLYLGDRIRFIIDWLDAKREMDLPFPETYYFSLGSPQNEPIPVESGGLSHWDTDPPPLGGNNKRYNNNKQL